MGLSKAEIRKKMAEATTTGGGNNLRDGRGRLVVKKLAMEDKFNGTTFVAEFVVVSSQKTPVTEVKTGKSLDITPNEVGSDVSWVQLFDKHPSAFGNVKGFVLELMGMSEAEVTEKDYLDAFDTITENNSAYGMVIDFSTYRKVTREKEVEIVIPKWSRVEQGESDILAMRQWLESLVAASKGPNA